MRGMIHPLEAAPSVLNAWILETRMGAKEKRPALPSLCARGHHTITNDPHRERLPELASAIIKSLEADDSPDHVGFPMIPNQESLLRIHDLYLTILMPGYHGDQSIDAPNVGFYLGSKVDQFSVQFIKEIHRMGIKPTMFGLEYSYNWFESMPEIKRCIDFFNKVTVKLAK